MVHYFNFGIHVVAFYYCPKNLKTQIYGLLGSRRDRALHRLLDHYLFRWNDRKRLETRWINAAFSRRLVESCFGGSKHFVGFVIPNELFPNLQRYLFINLGLKNSNDTKMSRACMVGLGTVAFFYILVGNVGYAMYGSNVQTNFLLNLKIDDLSDFLFYAMNGGFLISIFFSFPVMFFGARNNFIALIQIIMTRNKG